VISPIVLDGDDATPTNLRRIAALAATAAVLVRPGQVITGRSGAILHGLPTFGIPERPQLTASRMTSGRRDRTHVYRAGLPEVDIGSWFGAPVGTVARTVTELARHDRRDGIMAADMALRWRLATLPDMLAVLDREVGWPYSRRARELLALVDGRAESPLESIVRLALHDDGFPTPEPQYVIGPYRVDLCWPEYRFVVEADGRGKYADDDEKWREKRREIALRRMGYRVERVVWADVATNAAWRVTSAYLRREMRA
jgi:very-short-patch-repair endonuclease